jgi:hypothetical protein
MSTNVPVPRWHPRSAITRVYESPEESTSVFGFFWHDRFVRQLWSPDIERLRRFVSRQTEYEEAIKDLPPATVFRNKIYGELCMFAGYNYHGLGEFIAQFEDGSKSSEMVGDWCPVDGRWPHER